MHKVLVIYDNYSSMNKNSRLSLVPYLEFQSNYMIIKSQHIFIIYEIYKLTKKLYTS